MQDRPNGIRSRPVVLITCDLDHAEDAVEDRCHVRSAYARALEEAGALPLILTPSTALLPHIGALCDGVLFTGSAPGALQSGARGQFEADLAKAVLDARLPCLGICHGMQVIGQALGARLGEVPAGPVDHDPPGGPGMPAHPITLVDGTLLRALAGAEVVQTNSMHRQALTGCGAFTVAAISPDGVIEAIEGKGPAFCMGLQWHPEYGLTAMDRSIFAGFVAACAVRMSTRVNPM